MLWDPFLIKKLLKSVICGSVNSARVHYSRLTWSVWIEFIFAETKNWNWKYCSKIIFKCVDSIAGPIFNKKVVEKWNLWVHEQCTKALFMKDLVKCCCWIKKKKKWQNVHRNFQCSPNRHIMGTVVTFYGYQSYFLISLLWKI